MNRIRSTILLLVYSVTLLSVPVSARSYAFVVSAAENTEKEVVTNSTFEHRETSSIKITGKLTATKVPKSSVSQRLDDDYQPGTFTNAVLACKQVPFYIMHCIYRL